jgi:mannitol-specific phosphotransferase system IIBC component
MNQKFKKLACVVLVMVVTIAIILYFNYSNHAESFGSNRTDSSNKSGAYAKCSQIPDCKTCGSTKTSQDGVCYWCDAGAGKKSCQVWSNTGNCSSDQKDCGIGGNKPAAAIHKVKNN